VYSSQNTPLQASGQPRQHTHSPLEDSHFSI
jgi:hypothetical protein